MFSCRTASNSLDDRVFLVSAIDLLSLLLILGGVIVNACANAVNTVCSANPILNFPMQLI